MTIRRTMANVQAVVGAALSDPEIEFHKGDGYFYFTGGRADRWPTQGVYVARLLDLEMDGWVRAAKELDNEGC